MKYTIKKITIDKTAADLLISKMARWVRNEDDTELSKRAKETCFPSDDGLVDCYLKIQFNSDYRWVDGGIQCMERGVVASVTMCDAETGDEIGYDCPVALEEEIQKIFWI